MAYDYAAAQTLSATLDEAGGVALEKLFDGAGRSARSAPPPEERHEGLAHALGSELGRTVLTQDARVHGRDESHSTIYSRKASVGAVQALGYPLSARRVPRLVSAGGVVLVASAHRARKSEGKVMALNACKESK